MNIHVFGQYGPHDNVKIIGDLEGLIVLSQIVSRAIYLYEQDNLDSITSMEASQNDGESYDIHVIATNNMANIPRSYIDGNFNGSASFPDDLIKLIRNKQSES